MKSACLHRSMLYFQQKGIRLFKKCFWKVQKQLLLSGVCVCKSRAPVSMCVQIQAPLTRTLQSQQDLGWLVGGRTCLVHGNARAGISIPHNAGFYSTKVITFHPLKQPQECVLCCYGQASAMLEEPLL